MTMERIKQEAVFNIGDVVLFSRTPSTNVKWIVEDRANSASEGVVYQVTHGKTTLCSVPEASLMRFVPQGRKGVYTGRSR